MDKNERALELDKILELVARECTCDDAAATVISVVYSGDAFEVKG